MSTELKKRNVPFSPPDMTEAEAKMAMEAIMSGWITTGPKTKLFEKKIADFVGVGNGTTPNTPNTHTTPCCVCLNSATAAMEMALRLIGVGKDDEVIVPAYTYTASASVTQHVGCKLVMVDCVNSNANSDSDSNKRNCFSLEMDYDKLAEAITERTKVIVPVDLGGVVCDYDRIMEIVEQKRGLFRPANELQRRIGRIVISADCAHAFGSWKMVSSGFNRFQKVSSGFNRFQKVSSGSNSETSEATETLKLSETKAKRMAGSIADFSSFSFHAVKNLTTAEGGALTWNLPFGEDNVNLNADPNYFPSVPRKEGETWNEFLYRVSQLLSLHGQNKDALAKTKLGAWEYDIIGPWYKCNMTDIMAGIGLAQLERYPEILEKRYRFVERYNEAIDTMNLDLDAEHQVVYLDHRGEDHCSSHHLYIVRLKGRTREEVNGVIELMAERGIATNVHYKPLPMMTAYRALGFDIKDFPNAYRLFENEITLPLNTRMTEEDVEYVIRNFCMIVSGLGSF